MDECLDWQGQLLPHNHPYNFRTFMEKYFYGDIHPDLAVPEELRYWLTPATMQRVKAAIEAAPIDITVGGWGQDGHIAYNQARRHPFHHPTIREIADSTIRIQDNNIDTIVTLAQRSFGAAYQFVPPMSITLGIRECLSAKRVRVYSDTGAWKQTALRVALFSDPVAEYPMTLLQTHPDARITATRETARHPSAKTQTGSSCERQSAVPSLPHPLLPCDRCGRHRHRYHRRARWRRYAGTNRKQDGTSSRCAGLLQTAHCQTLDFALLLGGEGGGGACRVMAVGNVGCDDAGTALLREMADAGIDTACVHVEPERKTLFSLSFLYPDKSSGNITISNSAAAELGSAQLDRCRTELAAARPRAVALCLPEVPLEARNEFLRIATGCRNYRIASFLAGEMEAVRSFSCSRGSTCSPSTVKKQRRWRRGEQRGAAAGAGCLPARGD